MDNAGTRILRVPLKKTKNHQMKPPCPKCTKYDLQSTFVVQGFCEIGCSCSCHFPVNQKEEVLREILFKIQELERYVKSRM